MRLPGVGIVVALLLCVFVCAQGWAHEIRPGYLELKEQSARSFLVLWKGPAKGNLRLRLNPIFPGSCRQTTPGSANAAPGAIVERWSLHCEDGLEGKVIAIEGLETTLTDVLVRVELANGATQTHLLRPTATSVKIDSAADGSIPVVGYLRLGIEHIILGVDHLLFALGLLLIIRDRWMLVKTITSFTLAHSITLAIATLGYASAPIEPLNAAIALSILFLGPEIVRSWRGQTSLTIRRPWLVAFAFGLLHGFGFASGLTTMGLPESTIPFVLLLFNLGVEAGQILFVVLVVVLERSFVQLEIRWPRWVQALPGYAVGSLGAFWTIQRTAVLVGIVV